MIDNEHDISTLQETTPLNFAGISVDLGTITEINQSDSPFTNFSKVLEEKNRDEFIRLINNYNKHANDLEKIIVINN